MAEGENEDLIHRIVEDIAGELERAARAPS
jgi:hypothetical protein